ncbi:hypothetical protein Anapl_08861 [Anas platyrhynchos]|uniref:Uncharacterized protein n=1 Tax=Anas platyrhynchos TaxID=8839 RepID=R0LC71_ANAPL|nr:hypothetical protein Anapl_08861 [Anas platyrhynchos]
MVLLIAVGANAVRQDLIYFTKGKSTRAVGRVTISTFPSLVSCPWGTDSAKAICHSSSFYCMRLTAAELVKVFFVSAMESMESGGQIKV